MATSPAVLREYLNAIQSTYQQDVGQERLLRQQRAEKSEELQCAVADLERFRLAQALLTKVAAFARKNLIDNLNGTITAGLRAIIHDVPSIAFNVLMGESGGKPTADWKLQFDRPKGLLSNNPEESDGGTRLDALNVSLRVALLELSRPKPTGPLMLDEPGKMMSAEYVPNMAPFLKRYLATSHRQGIMVTHHEVLKELADVGYTVSQGADGVSEVTLRA